MTPADARAKSRAPEDTASSAVTPHAAAGREAARPLAPVACAAGDRPAVIADAVRIVAWLSLSAGAIHGIAMVHHFSHWWLYGAFFLALTYGQVLWGVDVLRHPASDHRLVVGAFANLAIVGVWLFSRTVGVPIGPGAGTPEPVGIMDVAATVDELVLVAYVAVVVRTGLRVRRGFRTLIGVHRVRLAMMLCSVSVFASMLGHHSH